MGSIRAVALATCLVVAPGTIASAAPPPDDAPEAETGEQACDCEDVLTVDECVLARAIELNGQGQEKFEDGDYVGAIEVWEEAIILLPEQKRVRLAAPLANAHAKAYEVDGDIAHLREAKELFDAHLEHLDASNEKAREETEAELAAIDAEFARIEAERDQKIRGEEAVLREQALAEAEDDSKRRIRRIYTTVGGALLGLGGTSMVTMIVALQYGQSRDKQGDLLAMDPNIAQSQYDTLLAQGTSANTAAWITGVVGGALLVSGVAVTVIGQLRYKSMAAKGRDRDQARLRVQPYGLGFRF